MILSSTVKYSVVTLYFFLESGSGINRNSGRHNDKPSTFIHLGDVVETTKTGENILVGKKKKNHSNTQC